MGRGEREAQQAERHGHADVGGEAKHAGALATALLSSSTRVCAGLSAWDKHVGYRNLCMHPALALLPRSPSPKQQRAAGAGQQQPWELWPEEAQTPPSASPPSLLDCCQAALLRGLTPLSVCDLLQVADCLSPVADRLRRWAAERARLSFKAARRAGAAFLPSTVPTHCAGAPC